MRLLGLVTWSIAFILGFFVSKVLVGLVPILSAALIPGSGPTVGFSLLMGFLRLLIWLSFVWFAARLFRRFIFGEKNDEFPKNFTDSLTSYEASVVLPITRRSIGPVTVFLSGVSPNGG